MTVLVNPGDMKLGQLLLDVKNVSIFAKPALRLPVTVFYVLILQIDL
jgi:hypothetical protein